ncbi:MAG: response regulator, partial [Bacteroidales bacterium]|nr:response regulator [Bacteroidales bacterium]
TFRREYNIFTAISAKEGLKILDNENIDIILSDQRMPEMTGVEFLQRALNTHPKLNRILITGFTDFTALQNAINQAKIFQYIQKPWQESDLRTTIEDAIKVTALEKANKKLSKELLKANEKLIKTNKKLEIAKNKAEESDRLKSVFFSNISHEIRTPMNGILGFSRILCQGDITDVERTNFVNIIIKSGEQLMHIIDDIIEIARIEVANIKIDNNALYIDKFLKNIIEVYNNNFDVDKIKIKLINDIKQDDNYIITDEFKLRKIIQNLIDNSRKYTEKGFINVHCKRIGDKIKICVKDSGIGVNLEMKEIIFERFRQEDENLTRKFGGLGLGLSIVKKNVELLGGKIELESEKGKGSNFFFEIPYKKAIKKENILITKTNENKKKKSTFTILIAEDEQLNFLFFKTILEKMERNFNIIQAKNGIEAIEISKSNKEIDLILMDIKMPLMDGLEATKEIKKLNKNLPIIVQTAYVTAEDKENAVIAGCDHFITKPINKDTLTQIFDQYLI